MNVIQRGDTGSVVKRIQRKVGTNPDGDYGIITERAVTQWQEDHGLVADGIVGPLTYRRMFPVRSIVKRPADLIVLDIGHGLGNRTPGVMDPGAVAGGKREHELATTLVDALRVELMKRGRAVRVISDMHVTKRDDVAKRYAPVLFVSNHLNAGGGTGTEVLLHRRAGMKLHRRAARVSAVIAFAFGLRDRGVKTDTRGLAVLQGMPAKTMLIEWAFIDDPDDRKAVARYTRKAAVAVANALTEA